MRISDSRKSKLFGQLREQEQIAADLRLESQKLLAENLRLQVELKCAQNQVARLQERLKAAQENALQPFPDAELQPFQFEKLQGE